MLFRFLPVFLVGVYGLKDRMLARYFWIVPIRDLVTFGIWAVSFVGNQIQWRGVDFRVLPGGQIAPVCLRTQQVAKQ
jgi:ceramide glucosyltransferase